jgi:spore germination protein YaaH
MKNMKKYKLLQVMASCILFLALTVSCRQEAETLTESVKKVSPWYLWEDGRSFSDIERVKDMIGSVIVFGGRATKSFIEECHENNIEVWLCVAGHEKDINTSEKIQALTDEYVNICHTDGYDGIDLDFERLRADFQTSYSGFLREASVKLHNAGKKLSHCVGFYPHLYKKEGKPEIFYDPEVLASTCDIVRVMCYDMYYAPGKNAANPIGGDDCTGIGATSVYPWAKDAMLFWLEHISKEKLGMALPAYSNDYTLTGNINGRQVYASLPDNVAGILPDPVWLWYEKINMYLYDDSAGRRHVFYASDSRSTEALLEIADELKIRHTGFWNFQSVDPKMWDVVRKWMDKQ